MTNRIFLSTSITVLSLTLASLSFAHGKKEHSDEATEFDAVTKEFGSYDPELTPAKTVSISMADTMRFTPSKLEVKAGDVVKFVVTNEGQLQHEFVLGTAESLLEHNEMMKKFPGMEHEEPYMAHVDPGKEMEITWQFSNAGTFEFGCLLPGHFAAGMKGTVIVN